MSVLSTFSEEDFNTQRVQWENLLKKELKLTELGHKCFKRSIDGGSSPTLSLECNHPIHLQSKLQWKKASQTYAVIDEARIEKQLRDDLDHGVKSFFLYEEFLTAANWKKVSSSLPTEEIEVFLLGKKNESEKEIFSDPRVIREVSGRLVHELGGNNFQELGYLTCQLIEGLKGLKEKGESASLYLGVFTDSQFFRNIAKIRAAKLLAMKVLEEAKVNRGVHIVALTSLREWTLYERYSNILRNDAAVASAYIGGADYVQSCGYDILWERETGTTGSEHTERSLRMARNTAHILALESMLGVVEDAAYGSYHLESLTERYAEEGWREMQRLLPLGDREREELLLSECALIREKRLEEVRTRKHVLAGLNDFPDPLETLGLKSKPKATFFRVACELEELRIRMENARVKPVVSIGVMGDYAALNARLNFTKNYFQLLGLKVEEVLDIQDLLQKKDIVVLCAQDEEYSKLQGLSFKAKERFIAGKVGMPGFINLFSGQNIVDVLTKVCESYE